MTKSANTRRTSRKARKTTVKFTAADRANLGVLHLLGRVARAC